MSFASTIRLAALGLVLSAALPASAQECPGDCDGDDAVVISELVRGVAISLGNRAPEACPAFDVSGDERVSVAEIITAVRVSIEGCVGNFLGAYARVQSQAAALTPKDLAELYPPPPYVEDIGYHAGDAKYLTEIAADTEPSSEQLELLDENGFVVLDDVSHRTFESAYKHIYEADLPVFISTDSILYALHRSYAAILEYLELRVLVDEVGGMLSRMHAGLELMLRQGEISARMQSAARDVDVYLTVARTLLEEEPARAFSGAEAARAVAAILANVEAEQPSRLAIFGASVTYDYSQMKPRGHYERIPKLRRYFRTMMWLGRTEMALVDLSGGAPRFNRSAFDAAFLMHLLLRDSGARPRWDRVNLAIEHMVGERDSMDPRDMDVFAAANRLNDLADLDATSDGRLREALLASPYGLQRIMSQVIATDPNAATFVLPRVFLLLGQRFVIDSYVFHHVTYDRLIDPGSGTKTRRMLPSELDVMFALGANGAVELLGDELARHSHQGTLHELRFLIDEHPSSFWEANLYNGWLDALRALNDDLTRPQRPASMRTRAWSRKTLETQLASWAELRHDTILYSKQSYVGGIACTYPDAYLEPAPSFFAAMQRLGERGSEMAAELTAHGFDIDRFARYFANMQELMARLLAIAQRELEGEPLPEDDLLLLRRTIEKEIRGCGEVFYDGWYPTLFFDRTDLTIFEPTIADVHTAPTDAAGNQVGWVLHAATGKANLMIFTQNDCDGPKAYVGPVSSYHSVLTTNFQRRTDSEWKVSVEQGQSTPSWTSAYRR